jgi:hypothetical protein
VGEDRERFGGWIAGLGTASGHRVVVGHWTRSPFGVVTDVMAEDPAGRRTLYAPTPQLAAFLGAAYRFDEVQVVAGRACRSGPDWTVQAGPLWLSFTVGRRTPLGWLLRTVPAPLARTTWWVGLLDLPARRLLPGVRTRGRTRDGRRQWYGASDLYALVAAEATLAGRNLGPLRPIVHRSASASARCRAAPPWSTSPPRSRLPALRMAATLPLAKLGPPGASVEGSPD